MVELALPPCPAPLKLPHPLSQAGQLIQQPQQVSACAASSCQAGYYIYTGVQRNYVYTC